VAFREIVDALKGHYPEGTSDRFRRLDAYEKLLNNKLYDHLPHAFITESNGGSHVPFAQRRPSETYNLAEIIVSQTAGLLFGDEQAPTVRCHDDKADGENPDKDTEDAIETLIDTLELDAYLHEAVYVGSPGSVAIVVRAVGPDKRPYIEIVNGKFGMPIYATLEPDKLVALRQIYPVKGDDLIPLGYDAIEGGDYWMRLDITETNEVRYVPLSDTDYQRLGTKDPVTHKVIEWELDAERSFTHAFQCVPVVWIKNLGRTTFGIDGPCTFGSIVDLIVSIDYGISQTTRGFRFTAEPMLAIARGELADQNIEGPLGDGTLKDSGGRPVRTGANFLDLEHGASAQMLEIAGKGLTGFKEYLEMLREWALEVLGGMKASAEHTKGAPSGKALEMLHQALILLVKRQRLAYGNRGYVPLLRVILKGISNGAIVVNGISNVNPDVPLRLVWPSWMLPTGTDLMAHAQGLQELAGMGPDGQTRPLLPESALVRLAANAVGINDAQQAIAELETQRTKEDAVKAQNAHDAAALQAAVKTAAPPAKK